MVVDGASTKDEGDYGSSGSIRFENPPMIGIREDESFHERQSLTKRQRFPPTMSVNEIFKIVNDLDDKEAIELFEMLNGHHPHVHYTTRLPWLRAAVLGSYDGLISISSLIMGVAGAFSGGTNANRLLKLYILLLDEDKYQDIVLTGISGIIAGSLSMSIGEFTSVQSQRDSERADVEREIEEQKKGPKEQTRELVELAIIWQHRGLPPSLALKVAIELSKEDAWKAHARDELNIDIDSYANPSIAAGASMLSFFVGGTIPILAFILFPRNRELALVSTTAVLLAVLGAFFAWFGGSNIWIATFRMTLAGLAALTVTYLIGKVIGGA